jgi:hypothetical protein
LLAAPFVSDHSLRQEFVESRIAGACVPEVARIRNPKLRIALTAANRLALAHLTEGDPFGEETF